MKNPVRDKFRAFMGMKYSVGVSIHLHAQEAPRKNLYTAMPYNRNEKAFILKACCSVLQNAKSFDCDRKVVIH